MSVAIIRLSLILRNACLHDALVRSVDCISPIDESCIAADIVFIFIICTRSSAIFLLFVFSFNADFRSSFESRFTTLLSWRYSGFLLARLFYLPAIISQIILFHPTIFQIRG